MALVALVFAAEAQAATYNATGWLPRFASRGDEPIGLNQTYLLNAGLPAVIWIALGLIVFLVFVWWECW